MFSVPTLGLARAREAPQQISSDLAVVLTSKVQGERRETAEEQRHRTANTGTSVEGLRGGHERSKAERETWRMGV